MFSFYKGERFQRKGSNVKKKKYEVKAVQHHWISFSAWMEGHIFIFQEQMNNWLFKSWEWCQLRHNLRNCKENNHWYMV